MAGALFGLLVRLGEWFKQGPTSPISLLISLSCPLLVFFATTDRAWFLRRWRENRILPSKEDFNEFYLPTFRRLAIFLVAMLIVLIGSSPLVKPN